MEASRKGMVLDGLIGSVPAPGAGGDCGPVRSAHLNRSSVPVETAHDRRSENVRNHETAPGAGTALDRGHRHRGRVGCSEDLLAWVGTPGLLKDGLKDLCAAVRIPGNTEVCGAPVCRACQPSRGGLTP